MAEDETDNGPTLALETLMFYHRETLQVGSSLAEVYVPTNPRENLLPSKQYLDFLISGAVEMNQPQEYIEKLKSHPYKENFALDHSFNLRDPSYAWSMTGFAKNSVILI